MTFQLRDFVSSDAEAVDGVVVAAFSQFRNAYSDWTAFSGNLGQMVAQASNSEIIVAEHSGTVVGAVAYVGPGKPKRAFFAPEWPVIRILAVRPEHRGQGIGRALSEECIARARRDGASVIALHTSPLMSVALPMYERMGFQKEREIEPIYGVPYGVYLKQLDAPIMSKDDRRILIAREAGIAIRTLDDVSEAISGCLGADGLILTEDELGPAFFDLRTGLAGEAMQKFVNYRVRVALVVSAPESYGERFVELAREHSRHPMIRILETEDAARAWLRST